MHYKGLFAILENSGQLVSLKSKAPTRIDLGGGTLDIWPLYLLLENAATVNVAINVFAEAEIEKSSNGRYRVSDLSGGREVESDSPRALAELPGAEIAGRLVAFFSPAEPYSISTRSLAPPQSGLGASSALGIAVAGGLNAATGFRHSGVELIEIVKDVEAQVLGAMTGSQDHFPPLFGGAACLWWGVGGTRRESLALDAARFEERFLLAYTHQPHRSGANNWEVVKRFLDGDGETRRAFERIVQVTLAMREAILASDFDRMARLLGDEWEARVGLAPAVRSPELDALLATARAAGAESGKACGAGGGGCLLLAVTPEKRKAVEAAVQSGGGSIVPFRVSARGLHFD